MPHQSGGREKRDGKRNGIYGKGGGICAQPSGLCAPGRGKSAGAGRFYGKRGYEVFCVEPNAAMRARAEATYGQNLRFHSVPASAEHTGLPAESLSLITAASSFHWLDTALFHSECCRLMKPGGIVCILANVRRYDAFTRAQHALCLRYCPGYTSLTHGAEKVQARAGAFFKGGYDAETFSFPLQYSREGFISRSLSSSYGPSPGTAEYEGYIRALGALLDTVMEGDCLSVANDTLLLWGELS